MKKKSSIGPIKIYCAGKISKNDWRHQLTSGILRGIDIDDIIADHMRPISSMMDNKFDYTGPFFQSCDHGCYHRDRTHGNGRLEMTEGGIVGCECVPPISSNNILKVCLGCIDHSDVVFAYINSLDSYGTFAEIGYAYGQGIPVIIAYESTFYVSMREDIGSIDDTKHRPDGSYDRSTELWFIEQMAKEIHFVELFYEKPKEEFLKIVAKSKLLSPTWSTYKDYLNSPEWQTQRTKCLDHYGWRCALCGTNNGLAVHHRKYDARWGNEDPKVDLIPLCKGCHSKFHDKKIK